ncbi:MAG: ATP-binding cassette domain-containing protein [Bacteroidia bacterium]
MNRLKFRLKEVKQHIEEHDLSRATRRLLDLFIDYSLPRNLKLDAVALRVAYNEYVVTEKSQVNEAKYEELLQDAAHILQAIEKQLIENENIIEEFSAAEETHATKEQERIVVQATNLNKSFVTSGNTFRLPPLSLTMNSGEITGIVGENGNGKTTLLRMIAGDLEADGGKLQYPHFVQNGWDWYTIKNQIAYIPQYITKWAGLLKTNLQFTAAVHGLLGKDNEEQVNFIIHRLGLSKYENATWNEISGGYKLRFELAKALVWRPRLLIIDEPLAHLDINAQQLFIQDLRYLASSEKHPMSVLISSQHLHEIESISDNILFIKNGELLYNGKMQEFGSDRKENLFELLTPASKTEMLEILAHLPHIRIEEAGKKKVLRTPIEVKSSHLLAAISQQSIEIQYFRDISTSTLKLFRDKTD